MLELCVNLPTMFISHDSRRKLLLVAFAMICCQSISAIEKQQKMALNKFGDALSGKFGLNHRADYSSLNVLETDYKARSGSYGVMFDIHALKTIVISSMDFHTDRTTVVSFEVYTKNKSYIPSKNRIEDWTKIASGTTVGNGKGKPSSIPSESFSPLTVESGTIRGIYMTLITPDVRYGKGAEVGEVYSSNADLEILEGSGIADYPLYSGSIAYSPRIFNGAIHYSIIGDGENNMKESQTTEVLFRYFIEDSTALSNNFIIDSTNEAFVSGLAELMEDDTQSLKDLAVENHVSFSVHSHINTEEQCSAYIGRDNCYVVDTILTVSHDFKLRPEEIRASFLEYANDLTGGTTFKIQKYIGPKIISTKGKQSLNGLSGELQLEEILVFEKVLEKFLNEDTLRLTPPVRIVSVRVQSQDLVGSEMRKLGNKFQASKEKSPTLDIETVITGEYQPPPTVNLGEVVEDSFNQRGEEFIEVLSKNIGFENVEGIFYKSSLPNAKITSGSEIKQGTFNDSENTHLGKSFFSSPLYMSLIASVGVISLIINVILVKKYAFRNKDESVIPNDGDSAEHIPSTSDIPKRNSQTVASGGMA